MSRWSAARLADRLRRYLEAGVLVGVLLCFSRGQSVVAQTPIAEAVGKLPRVVVAPGGHLFETEDGRPFFWLGDTAWELVHHTTREEASYYLHRRAEQGFTVVQTVVLSEFDGLSPSALGTKPFLDDGFTQPNPAYFDRLVQLVDEAAADGMYVALVPIWGDKLTAPWGTGPRIFRTNNLPAARAFARYVAGRIADRPNVIWVLGGDRPPRISSVGGPGLQSTAAKAGFPPGMDWTPIWREVAAGLKEGSGGRVPLIAYHPQGGENSSSVYLHNEPWLRVNGMQSGHGGGHDMPVWKWVARDYALVPAKPTLDLEPNYEDHPVSPWPTWDAAAGYFRDVDVRKQVYRSVLAGAAGVTYGHHAVWGFLNARNQPVTFADMGWVEAMDRPGGRQMRFLRELIESRPFFRRVPDAELVANNSETGALHMVSARDAEGSYALIYVPTSDTDVQVRMERLRMKTARLWWFDPRSGIGTLVGERSGGGVLTLRTPGYGPDWVLVVDDAAAGYAPPGLRSASQ